MKGTPWLLAATLLLGCGPFVPVTDLSTVAQDSVKKAAQIPVFEFGHPANHPPIADRLGIVSAYSCKHLLWDPPATKEDALLKLRLKALEMGAHGIVDVVFENKGTGLDTNCWETWQAKGTVVTFQTISSKATSTQS